MDAKSRSRALRRGLEGCFFRGNLPALIISVLCMLLLTGVNLVAAWLMQQLVDIVVSGGAGLGGILLTFAAAFSVFILAYDVQRYTCAAFVRRAVVQYKNFAFSGILERSVSFVSQENSAKFISILTNDVASIETNYLAKVFTLVMELAGFVGALGMMLWYSPILTAAAAVLALLPVGASLLCGGRLARCEAEVSAKNESYVETVKESFAGFSVIKSFRAEASVRGMFEQVSGSLEDAKYSRRKVNDLVYMLAGGAGFLAQFGVFIAAALLAGGGFAISAGVAVAFLQLMNFLVSPISSVPPILANRRASMELVEKLAALMAEPGESGGREVPAELREGIEIKNLSFAYAEGESVLRDVSLRIPAGGSLAIVGPSGSGKSTLLQLLMGHHPGYEGSIRLDGAELREIAPASLYELLSVIQQEVFIFNSSIEQNVTMFGKFEPERVEAAIAGAGLGELTAARGLDFVCGENGANLSGGERQRVSIARSLLKRTPVLLVDEATAALDRPTAAEVMGAVLDIPDTAKIVVTHDLNEAVLRRFDAVAVLIGGRLRELGSFDELLAARGFLYSMLTLSAASED